jgi:N-formylglutamate deformylase
MTEHPVLTLHRGTTPLLLSLPHVGTRIPAALQPRYVERALAAEDTDWHLETVYAFAGDLGASVITACHSRYVIDLNRPPGNAPMYPGANNTELVPTRFFTGEPLYRDGQQPGDAEVADRLQRFWRPYHDALAGELERLRAAHGHALLWDGHSIRSRLPWLFDGTLPDLNLGTADAASCAPSLRAALMSCLGSQSDFSHVTDGRFKGGYITRHYGRPAEGVHAVQMEQCWSTYMAQSPPYTPDPARLARVQPLLRRLLRVMLDWAPQA